MLLGVMKPFGAVPSGEIDGVNRVYTLPDAPIPYTLNLFKNGEFQTPSVDYIIMGNQITYTVPMQPPTAETTGDQHYAQYLC